MVTKYTTIHFEKGILKNATTNNNIEIETLAWHSSLSNHQN